MAVDGRSFARDVLRRYRVRPEAAERILAHCDVTVLNPDSVQGGGMVQYTTRPDYWHVVLHTRQEEAALHEAAHVHYELIQTDAWIAAFRGEYFYQADMVHKPRFRLVRQACHEGVYGNDQGFPGYRTGNLSNPWYTTEMYAGLISLVMGHVEWMPPRLRKFFDRPGCFYQAYERVMLPVVFG